MLTLVTPPSSLAIALADVKAHLRITHTSEDDLITAYLQAATRSAEHETNRALLTQTWQLKLRAWPADGRIHVPRPVLQSVTSLVYVDVAGHGQTLVEDTDFMAYPDVADCTVLAPVYGTNWPTARLQEAAITLTYVAGWADAATLAAQAPEIVAAIYLMTAELYERREEAVTGTIISEVPLAARRLLSPWRVYALGEDNAA